MTAKFVIFDVESSGTDVFNDRIVQLFVATADGNGNLIDTWEWVIDPGVEVPDGAAEVHGFTTEYLQEHGRDAKKALWEAWNVFNELRGKGLTWVAYNANFDLSILNAEFTRYGLDNGWAQGIEREEQIIDAIVIDRTKDKYRKGKRTLEAVARHYGVPFDADKAHDARYDCEVTAKVTVAVLKKYGYATNEEQKKWYRSWAEGLEKYFQRTDPEAKVNKDWPVRLEEKE